MCGAHVDGKGHHLLADSFGGVVCARHDDLKIALAGLVTDEVCTTSAELHLTSASGQLICRADVSWARNTLVGHHVDVSVVMPTSRTAMVMGDALRGEVAATDM